jgi:hypothetical protein
LLKPRRLMSASASGKRKMRGFGLPGCGRGVTVPTSMKPKPIAPKPSMQRPFLSRPAGQPDAVRETSAQATVTGSVHARLRDGGTRAACAGCARATPRSGHGPLGVEAEQEGAGERVGNEGHGDASWIIAGLSQSTIFAMTQDELKALVGRAALAYVVPAASSASAPARR